MLNKFLKNIQGLVNKGITTSHLLRNEDECKEESSKKKPKSVSMPKKGGGHKANAKLWRRIVFFGTFPVLILIVVNTYIGVTAHEHERPEFVPYTYLRLRNKRYPWGDGQHTFFHNKKLNALPDGYEEDEENK